jgi:hypothetical protein
MRLFSILTLALLATTLARAEQLVFTIDSAPMSYLHGVLQAYLDDSSIYVTGENTPANNGVSEMVSDYGFSADFSSFDSHQGNRWVFPAGAGVVVAGNMFFYPGVDPRNIFCFCGILETGAVGETVLTTSDGTNFTLTDNLYPGGVNPLLLDFYGISGNASSAVLNLQWENGHLDSLLFEGDATGTLVIDYVPESSSTLLFASAAGFALLAGMARSTRRYRKLQRLACR